MRYSDRVTFYEPKTTVYSQEPLPDKDKATEAMVVFIPGGAIANAGYYDQMAGDAYMYVRASDPYAVNQHGDLLGKFVGYGDRMYRVTDAAVGEHKLTNGKPMFIRCVLAVTAHQLEEV